MECKRTIRIAVTLSFINPHRGRPGIPRTAHGWTRCRRALCRTVTSLHVAPSPRRQQNLNHFMECSSIHIFEFSSLKTEYVLQAATVRSGSRSQGYTSYVNKLVMKGQILSYSRSWNSILVHKRFDSKGLCAQMHRASELAFQFNKIMCAYAHRSVSCAGPTSPPHPGRLGGAL